MVDRIARLAAPGAVGLFVMIAAVLGGRSATVLVPCLVAAAAALVLMVRRQHQLAARLVAVALAAAAVAVLAWHDDASNLGWFAYCVLAGWVAFRGRLPELGVVVAGMVLLFGTQWAGDLEEPGWGAWMSGTVFTAVVTSLARRQTQLVEQLRDAQAGLAERARAEERNRIAREFHDVIGHNLTVALMHVSSARLTVDEDPADARAALEEAERLGRRSLDEVRQVVGMMKEDAAGDTAPMPGADGIEELVETVRRAGTPIELEVVGNRADLTATSGLALHRILQESLTNVARHAPDASAVVRLEVGPSDVRLCVDSAGAPATPRGDALGVVGMRERAEAVGGRLEAGPHEGGWRVEAVLPT